MTDRGLDASGVNLLPFHRRRCKSAESPFGAEALLVLASAPRDFLTHVKRTVKRACPDTEAGSHPFWAYTTPNFLEGLRLAPTPQPLGPSCKEPEGAAGGFGARLRKFHGSLSRATKHRPLDQRTDSVSGGSIWFHGRSSNGRKKRKKYGHQRDCSNASMLSFLPEQVV